jgi:hypothetical protein
MNSLKDIRIHNYRFIAINNEKDWPDYHHYISALEIKSEAYMISSILHL